MRGRNLEGELQSPRLIISSLMRIKMKILSLKGFKLLRISADWVRTELKQRNTTCLISLQSISVKNMELHKIKINKMISTAQVQTLLATIRKLQFKWWRSFKRKMKICALSSSNLNSRCSQAQSWTQVKAWDWASTSSIRCYSSLRTVQWQTATTSSYSQ